MSVEFSVALGKEKLIFNTGYLAKQADGSVALSYGESIVFASAVYSREVKEGQDFLPLTIDYREKSYAGGKIPGGFIKRESRPSDREVLVSRLSDRPIRPLFPDDFTNEVQVIIYVLSADRENQQDVVAINAASAALSISGMPFHGPVGAVRVGRIAGQWVINPTYSDMEKSDLDLVVAGTKKAVTMIEGSAKNVSEDDIFEAVKHAHPFIVKLCEAQESLALSVNKPKIEYTPFNADEALKAEIESRYRGELETLADLKKKKERESAFERIVKKASTELAEKYPDTIGQANGIMHDLDGQIVRKMILDKGVRADGRGLKDVRPIDIMIGIFPRTHGSAVFTRGETQSLGVTTLGSVSEAQRLDNIEGEKEKRFMLHYHFPPFSVGETGRHGGVGRREIGHGMLAERSLSYVLPSDLEFPYTIRQVSEIFESNGSSSMASVCSASLSMFSAGVPLKDSVAGIAMGLVTEGDRYAVLTDILGLEDHVGDMDFKVAGTSTGITAFQMDVKVEGIAPEIMKVALQQAREGRLHILGKMNEVISKPESNLSPHAPKVKKIKVEVDKIGGIIGSGGKTIRRIIEESGADIDIEDDGTVMISAVDQDSIDKAERIILSIVEDVEIDKIYEGTVKRIMDFGAFVEILPGKEGLLHISKLDRHRVQSVTDVVKLGDKVRVMVIGIDDKGRINLSRKDAL
jgi:polyribonucleotide nucleotidyltransferase